jgi:hypothetical protein
VLAWLVALLTALVMVVPAVFDSPVRRVAFVAVMVALAVLLVCWVRLCRVSACRVLMTLAVGAGLGVGVVGALWLLGALGPAATPLLAFGALVAGVLLALALVCARGTDWD